MSDPVVQSVKMAEGFTLFHPAGSYLGRSCAAGCYEPQQTEAVKRIVKRGWTFIDVGAGIGYYSMLAARIGCAVRAFEPSTVNADMVRRAIAANGADVRLFDVAAGRECGMADFSLSVANDGDNRLGVKHKTRHLRVRVVTLDSVKSQLFPLVAGRLFVKIDVQGVEADVLEGARQLIADYRPTMLVEARYSGTTYGLLESMGYDWTELGQRFQFCDLLAIPRL